MTLLRVLVPVFLLVLMAWRFGYMALIVRPRRPTRWFLADLRTACLGGERLASGAVAFLTIALFTGVFTFLKDAIPLIKPFSWDPAFAGLDRWLHGGRDPYALMMPLLKAPALTTALDAAYHFWFFLLYFVVFVACFDRDDSLRRATFLIAFVLTRAVGGNLLAAVISPVGPVYYAAFGYAPISCRWSRRCTGSPRSARSGRSTCTRCCWRAIATAARCAGYRRCPACMWPAPH